MYLSTLKEKIEIHNRTYGSSDKFVLIHFGVNGGLKEMEVQLERRCFNAKCFTDKNVPVRGPHSRIDRSKILDFDYKTGLPINAIYTRLHQAHPYLKLSDNPGRYLCNYI